MSIFNLHIQSFTPPTTTPSRPLSIEFQLPSAQLPKNALYPATHLQLAYVYAEGKQEIFAERPINSEDLTLVNEEEKVFELKVGREEIPRTKDGGKAEVVVYAWSLEKVVGRVEVGEVQV